LSIFRRLLKSEGGATVLEHVLIASLIGLAALQLSMQISSSPVT
jgi:Flp pilus assembly pilin Flp